MFRTSICPSSGVFYIQVVYWCVWCSALGVVAVVLRSRCVVLYTVCELVSNETANGTVRDVTHRLYGLVPHFRSFALSHGTSVNVLSLTVRGQERPFLSRFARNSQVLDGVKFRSPTRYVTHIRRKLMPPVRQLEL